MKVLHIVGGPLKFGASQGSKILHEALLELGVDSKLLNDSPPRNINTKKNIIYINESLLNKIKSFFFINYEKILKSFYFRRAKEIFTLGFVGFDLTKTNEYKNSDIIHIHWINQGFISLDMINKIKKPIVWTMRDMWTFTGGCHYSKECLNYLSNCGKCKVLNSQSKFDISTIVLKKKKNIFKKNIIFVALSDWLLQKAKKSSVLKTSKVIKISNNIEFHKFKRIDKKIAKKNLYLNTNKKILIYGAQNPQDIRKGWNVFTETLKLLDKSKYFLLLFGNFWSHKTLDDIGIEYKSFGYIDYFDNFEKLNNIYCAGDLFVATSIHEAFGKTFVESMSCGTPVICFDKTSISEIIEHKIDGYIVQNFSSKQLCFGIDWMIDNYSLEKYKINIIYKAEQFDSKKIARQYTDLYKKILTL
jgi:glycosyltransferase involved in cell wall biosynthesis